MRQLKITKHLTSRESVSIAKYLHDVGKIRLITKKEEVTLARKIHLGDGNALKINSRLLL